VASPPPPTAGKLKPEAAPHRKPGRLRKTAPAANPPAENSKPARAALEREKAAAAKIADAPTLADFVMRGEHCRAKFVPVMRVRWRGKS
jgi:hypothetical protein